MTSWASAIILFAIVFGGAVRHLFAIKTVRSPPDAGTRSIVQLITGLIATMAALLLNLLIASAHTFYDTQQTEVQHLSANIVLLDQDRDHIHVIRCALRGSGNVSDSGHEPSL